VDATPPFGRYPYRLLRGGGAAVDDVDACCNVARAVTEPDGRYEAVEGMPPRGGDDAVLALSGVRPRGEDALRGVIGTTRDEAVTAVLTLSPALATAAG